MWKINREVKDMLITHFHKTKPHISATVSPSSACCNNKKHFVRHPPFGVGLDAQREHCTEMSPDCAQCLGSPHSSLALWLLACQRRMITFSWRSPGTACFWWCGGTQEGADFGWASREHRKNHSTVVMHQCALSDG